MKFKLLYLAACSTMASVVLAADVVYPEKPETEPIVVGSGDMAMTQGYKLFRDDLWACWRFDDADNLFKDSSGHGHDLVLGGGTVEALSGDDDKVRGSSSAGFAAKGTYLSIGTVPDCLRGGSPFSISMWVRETDQVQMSTGTTPLPIGGYLYVGNSTTTHSSDYSTNCVAVQKCSGTQFYCGIPSINNTAYRTTLNLNTGTEMPEGN